MRARDRPTISGRPGHVGEYFLFLLQRIARAGYNRDMTTHRSGRREIRVLTTDEIIAGAGGRREQKGTGLDTWDRDPDWVGRATHFLGVPHHRGRWGQRFPCVLPGHTDEASLWQDKKRRFVLHCWCDDRFYPLVSVYVARQLGSVEALDEIRGPELARWKLRLLGELGDLDVPDDLEIFRPLPDDVPQHIRDFYDAFSLALRVRWLTDLGEAVPFSLRFAVRWSCNRFSMYQAEQARGWLITNNYMKKAGTYHKNTLWFPGSGPSDKV